MVKMLGTVRIVMIVLSVACIISAVAAPFALAQAPEAGVHGAAAPAANDPASGLRIAGIALGAGIALAGGAIGTGIVQSAVCASGIGVLAEKREMLPLVIILLAIPETLVILGFVVAIMLINLK